jgi:endogenous inhibitor of DNA gyrase (YacG/DUF329 family)
LPFSFLLLVVPNCPTCGQPVESQDSRWQPFCSERCKLIDFGRWADEEYRVPGRRIDPAPITEEPPAGEEEGKKPSES